MSCGHVRGSTKRPPKCIGRHHIFREQAHDEAAPFMRSVKFTRTSVMEIPCSWMPGGFIRIGGRPI